MVVEIDHYVVLGLPSGEEGAGLSDQEIKKAYRSKLLLMHPADFLKLFNSYQLLKDPKSRKLFDDHLRIQRERRQRRSRRSTSRSAASSSSFVGQDHIKSKITTRLSNPSKKDTTYSGGGGNDYDWLGTPSNCVAPATQGPLKKEKDATDSGGGGNNYDWLGRHSNCVPQRPFKKEKDATDSGGGNNYDWLGMHSNCVPQRPFKKEKDATDSRGGNNYDWLGTLSNCGATQRPLKKEKDATVQRPLKKEKDATDSGEGGNDNDYDHILGVLWHDEDYTVQRLCEIFGYFGRVEKVVIIGSKRNCSLGGSALVRMASKDAANAAAGCGYYVLGDHSNPLGVFHTREHHKNPLTNQAYGDFRQTLMNCHAAAATTDFGFSQFFV